MFTDVAIALSGAVHIRSLTLGGGLDSFEALALPDGIRLDEMGFSFWDSDGLDDWNCYNYTAREQTDPTNDGGVAGATPPFVCPV